MTEAHQPPNSRNNNPDQDTTTIPRVNVPGAGTSAAGQPAGSSSGGWSQPSRSDAGTASRSSYGSGGSSYGAGYGGTGASYAPPSEPEAPASGLGARLGAAASTVAAATSTVANNAKNSIRSAADEAEDRATRSAPRGRGGRGAARQPRRARLTLSHVNVYSVFKLSCVLAIALFFVWLIMIGVLYGILDVSGVFDRINQAVHQISGDGKTTNVVTGSLVGGLAIIIGVVYIVLFIALSTIGAMVYNLCADLVGGAEVTLSERE